MSERINQLPPDIVEIESGLAQLSLPASSINRDELLYRAGWAAAEAEQRGTVSQWLWPTTSAALAATLLFLLLTPISAPGFAGGAPEEQESSQIAAFQADESDLSRERQPRWPQIRGFRSRLPGMVTTWPIAMRHRTFMRQFDTPSMDIGFDDTSPPSSKTSRELMRELLPELEQSTENETRKNEIHWNWPKQLWEALS